MKKSRHMARKLPLTMIAGIFALSANLIDAASKNTPMAGEAAELIANDYTKHSLLNITASPPQFPAQHLAMSAAPSFQQHGLSTTSKIERPYSPFAHFVEVATGETLPIFGSNLFNLSPSTFAPTNATQVNPDYTIGVGDQIQVKGWGMVDIDLTLTVERNGTVYLPRVGSVAVAGIKFKDLQGTLKKSVSRVFNNFELTTSLLQARAVQVYVVGNVQSPGNYTLSGMSTLLNALFVAGGPNENGSMRNIQLMRNGKSVGSLDLYKILVDGDKSSDLTLRDGDIVHIPPTGERVALIGNVKIPAIYEFSPNERAADLLRWAGGLASTAENKRWRLEKNKNNQFEVQWQSGRNKNTLSTTFLTQLKLNAGDIFRVFAPDSLPVTLRHKNHFVLINGEVKQTGTVQLKKGETLRELIIRLGGAREDGYVFATMVHRESLRKEQQLRLDQIAIRSEHELAHSLSNILAQQRSQGNVTASLSEGDSRRQLLATLRSIKAEGRIVFELPGLNAQVTDLPDLALQNGDTICIPRRPDTVNVLGAVYQANGFIYRPKSTVKEYLDLAGGISPTGDKSGTYLIRANGAILSARNTDWPSSLDTHSIYPGDTIVVPDQLFQRDWTQVVKEWAGILYQFGLGAAVLRTVR